MISVTDRSEAYKNVSSDADRKFWSQFFKTEIDWSNTKIDDYAGKDCSVNGTVLQLKLRESAYSTDLLIEYANGDPEKGWINKNNQVCDYLAYGWRPLNKCVIINWKQLKDAWDKNHVDWFKTLGNKNIKIGYNTMNGVDQATMNLAVPFHMLEKAGVKINWR